MAAKTATSPGGYRYQIIPTAGGVYHVWPNGLRTFVPSAPKAPAAPAAVPKPTNTTPGFQPEAGITSPALDATYFGRSAQLRQQRDQALAQNDAQATSLVTSRDTALENLRRNYPLQRNQATAQANASGLFYSSTLGNQLGGIDATFTQNTGAVTSDYANRERARIAARQAIEAGYSTDDAAAMAEAADRAITRDTSAADAGYLTTDPVSPQALTPKVNQTQVKALQTLKAPKKPAAPTVRLSNGRVVPRATVNRTKTRWLAAARRAR